MVKFCAKKRQVKRKWQSIDNKSCPVPLGGEQTGKNPTDRGKRGSKIHIPVDQRGAPLAVVLTGANEHDKWSADDLIISIVVKRIPSKQHFCVNKGYDSVDSFHVDSAQLHELKFEEAIERNDCRHRL